MEIFKEILDQIKPEPWNTGKYVTSNGTPRPPKFHECASHVETIRHIAERIGNPFRQCIGKLYIYNGNHWAELQENTTKLFFVECNKASGMRKEEATTAVILQMMWDNLTSVAPVLIPPKQEEITEVRINLKNTVVCIDKSTAAISTRPATMDDCFFYQMSYDYIPGANWDKWQTFLEEVLPEPESRMLLAEYLGQCFLVGTKSEKVLFLTGSGGNGKGVVFEIIQRLFAHNVTYYPIENLCNDMRTAAKIENKLLNICGDVTGNIKDHARFKTIASNEKLTVEEKYKDPRDITTYAKMIFSTNNTIITDNTEGAYRRIILMPFDAVQVTDSTKIINLHERFYDEMPGILNWIIRGLRQYVKHNKVYTRSPKCEAALNKFKIVSDSVGNWVDDYQLSPSETEYAPIKDAFKVYQRFCDETGLQPCGVNEFSRRLKNWKFNIKRIGKAKITSVNISKMKLLQPID
ncbi:MAG: DNA primase family protein [Agriterribacter sp.]